MKELCATPGAIALEASRERVRQKNLQECRLETAQMCYNNTPAGQMRTFLRGIVYIGTFLVVLHQVGCLGR